MTGTVLCELSCLAGSPALHAYIGTRELSPLWRDRFAGWVQGDVGSAELVFYHWSFVGLFWSISLSDKYGEPENSICVIF